MNPSKRSMITLVEPATFIHSSSSRAIIDVRSPSEYRQGHITGALNIPIFSDDERAMVGTLYVQKGKDQAILRGLDIALPKVGRYLDMLQEFAKVPELSIYCWRGGFRSAAMGAVFRQAGYRVSIVRGGYKALRRHIREKLGEERKVVVVGGYTGSGKTDILKLLASMGEQVIDLEALANHKGSVFGAFGQPAQPTNEQFENDLFSQWQALDPGRILWLEDESRMIGRVTIPEPLVETIANANMIRVEIPLTIRIDRLVNEYGGFESELLAGAVGKLADKLGGLQAGMAIKALEEKRLGEVAAIMLRYYDKAYRFAIERRKGKRIYEVAIQDDDPRASAVRILETAKEIQHGNNIS